MNTVKPVIGSDQHLEDVLKDWMGEVAFQSGDTFREGAPRLGKFEAEELYRVADTWIKRRKEQPEPVVVSVQNEVVVLEKLRRVGAVEIRERIYGDPPEKPGFTWLDKPCVVKGTDFEYTAQLLCSFPKLNGQVRYIVEDHGRLFIQRIEQIKVVDFNAQSKDAGTEKVP